MFKEKKISNIFKRHYKKMLNITNKSNIVKNSDLELLPAMCIICDIAAVSSGKNREQISDVLLNEMIRLNTKMDMALFSKRCEQYGEIIRGGELRCDWFLGNELTVFYENAISKSTAFLCDILYNPECANDYYSAPIKIYGIDECLSFTQQVVFPLYKEMTELFKDIYDYQ